MNDGKQVRNITDEETELIQTVFFNNEALLKAIRALFLNLNVTEDEKELVRSTFKNKELLKIFKKRFCPELDKDIPIGQVQDVWLGVEEMVFGQHRDTIQQAVAYKDLSIRMVRQALGLLENPDGERININYDPSAAIDELQVFLLGRNQFIKHVEHQLLFIWVIAQQKPEDKQDKTKKAQKNSAQ